MKMTMIQRLEKALELLQDAQFQAEDSGTNLRLARMQDELETMIDNAQRDEIEFERNYRKQAK